MRRICGLLAVGLFLSVSPLRGQNPAANLTERLHKADAGSALDTPDVKPWHMKMTVQLFDDKGKPTDQGTIEEWWSSPDADRREYKTNSYTATEIRTLGKLHQTTGVGSPPYLLELLRDQAVHPMPKESDVTDSAPEMRRLPFGKVSLVCVMLSQRIKQDGLMPMGLFPTFCLDPDRDVLRASFDFGDETVLRNAFGTFQGREVATKVSVLTQKMEIAASQIVTLEGTPIAAAEFEPTEAETERNSSATKVSAGVIAGSILSRVDPVYPPVAKAKHLEGKVILHAIIGTDGHIHSLRVVSTPDPDLAIASIAAVRRWVYKPYLLFGSPTDVETTINVTFSFGSN